MINTVTTTQHEERSLELSRCPVLGIDLKLEVLKSDRTQMIHNDQFQLIPPHNDQTQPHTITFFASISVSTRACHNSSKYGRAKAGFDSQAESCEERSGGLLFFFFLFLSFSLFFFVVKEGGRILHILVVCLCMYVSDGVKGLGVGSWNSTWTTCV